jgi:hypothetical protein
MSENLKPGLFFIRKESVIIAVVVLVLFYAIPSLLRIGITHWQIKIATILVSDVIGAIVVGFITNNYRMALFLYVFSSFCEILLMILGFTIMANLVGDLFPAMVIIYFTNKLYFKLGN